MQVHDEPMKAVRVVLRDAGKAPDAGNFDFGRRFEMTGRSNGAEPYPELLALGRITGGDRADHGFCVAFDALEQRREAGSDNLAAPCQMSAADQRCQHGWRKSRCPAFDREIGDGAMWSPGMLNGSLKGTQAELDAIVRGQPFRNQRRQQNVGLSEFSDDCCFHGGAF